ncbi:MAG: hypothetical protein ACT4NY_01575 [Pseudonocardiales bacterium]
MRFVGFGRFLAPAGTPYEDRGLPPSSLDTSDVNSPAPDAAERIEDVLAQREEIQRHAWEAFNRAPGPPQPK